MNPGQSSAQNNNLSPTDALLYRLRNDRRGGNDNIGHHSEISGFQNTRLSEGALAGTAIRAYGEGSGRTAEEVANGLVGERIIKFPGNPVEGLGGEKAERAKSEDESNTGNRGEAINQAVSHLLEKKSDEQAPEPHEPEISRDGASTNHAEGNTPSDTVREVSAKFEEDPFTAYKLAREAAKKEYDKLSNGQGVAA